MVLWWVLSTPVAEREDILPVLQGAAQLRLSSLEILTRLVPRRFHLVTSDHLRFQFAMERAGVLFAAGPLGEIGIDPPWGFYVIIAEYYLTSDQLVHQTICLFGLTLNASQPPSPRSLQD